MIAKLSRNIGAATKLQSAVVPVMDGHLQDQAKLSVHDRWPLIGGTVGGAKRNSPYSRIVQIEVATA